MAMNNSLAEVRPELVPEWSEKNLPLKPDEITFGSNKKVWWRGACGHEWQTKGKSGSYSTNFQQSGRELLQPDEVRMLDNQNALLFIRGERPILDAKYDLMKHHNIRYTEDGGAGPFNYAKAPLAHDDFTFDETRYDDYELLLDEDIIGELF